MAVKKMESLRQDGPKQKTYSIHSPYTLLSHGLPPFEA